MGIRAYFVRKFGGPHQVKLSLARACLDMGDKAGACKLLQEVLAEGNTAEKRQAEILLVHAAK